MIVDFKWDKNICMTHPRIESNYHVNEDGSTTWYTTYNLEGLCTCGKRYFEHEHFVKHNQEIHDKYKKI
jgi:hypothetical protein